MVSCTVPDCESVEFLVDSYLGTVRMVQSGCP